MECRFITSNDFILQKLGCGGIKFEKESLGNCERSRCQK